MSTTETTAQLDAEQSEQPEMFEDRTCTGSFLGVAYKDCQPVPQKVRLACPRCARMVSTTRDGRIRLHTRLS